MDISTKLDLELRWIHHLQPMDPTLAGNKPTPEILKLAAKRTDNAESSYDNALLHCHARGGSILSF